MLEVNGPRFSYFLQSNYDDGDCDCDDGDGDGDCDDADVDCDDGDGDCDGEDDQKYLRLPKRPLLGLAGAGATSSLLDSRTGALLNRFLPTTNT